jgi:hypothetical protein
MVVKIGAFIPLYSNRSHLMDIFIPGNQPQIKAERHQIQYFNATILGPFWKGLCQVCNSLALLRSRPPRHAGDSRGINGPCDVSQRHEDANIKPRHGGGKRRSGPLSESTNQERAAILGNPNHFDTRGVAHQ